MKISRVASYSVDAWLLLGSSAGSWSRFSVGRPGGMEWTDSGMEGRHDPFGAAWLVGVEVPGTLPNSTRVRDRLERHHGFLWGLEREEKSGYLSCLKAFCRYRHKLYQDTERNGRVPPRTG